MKKLLIISIQLFLFQILHAQVFDWATTGGRIKQGGNAYGAIDMAIDTAGNYYTLVVSNSEQQCQGDTVNVYPGAKNNHAFIYKFNKEGEIQQILKIGSPTAGGSILPLAIECDEVGNTYILSVPNGTSDMAAQNQNFNVIPNTSFIVKFNSKGDYAWHRNTGFSTGNFGSLLKYHDGIIYYQSGNLTISSIDVNNNFNTDITPSNFIPATAYLGPFFRNAEVLSNGDLVFAAHCRGSITYGADVLPINADGYLHAPILLVRTTPNLNYEWAKFVAAGRDPENTFIPMTVDHNDNIYVGFQVYDTLILGTDTVINTSGNYVGNGALVKVNSSGNHVWAKHLETTWFTFVWAMANTHDNSGIYLGGGFNGNATFGNTTLHNTNLYLPFVTKMDYDGNFINALKVLSDNYYTDVNSMVSDGKGGFGICGLMGGATIPEFQCISAPVNNGFYVAHFRDLDTLIPVPTIVVNNNLLTATPAFTGTIQWFFNNQPIAGENNQSLAITNEGSYTVQYFINNCLDTTMSMPYIYENVGLNNLQLDGLISVYPNPSNGIFTINLGSNFIAQISVFDMMGKRILKFNSASNTQTIDLGSLASGVYFLQIEQAAKVAQTKLIKN